MTYISWNPIESAIAEMAQNNHLKPGEVLAKGKRFLGIKIETAIELNHLLERKRSSPCHCQQAMNSDALSSIIDSINFSLALFSNRITNSISTWVFYYAYTVHARSSDVISNL